MPGDGLDALIARGPPLIDFSPIGDLPKAYWEGLNQRHAQDLREVFKGGVPTLPDGSVDYGAMSKAIYQKGDLGQGTALSNLDLQRQQIKLGQQAAGNIDGSMPPSAAAGPAASTVPLVSPSANRQPRPPQSPTGYTGGNNGQTTIDAVLGQRLPEGHPDYGPLKLRIAAGLKVDPDQPLTPEQLTRVTQALDARPALGGAPGGAAPAPQGPPAQVAPATPQAAPAPFAQRFDAAGGPSGFSVPTQDPQVQRTIQVLTERAANPIYGKTVNEAAKVRLEQYMKSIEPTGPLKEYDQARRQGFKGTFEEYQTKTESDKTFAAESTKTYIKKYEAIQTAGERARDDIPKLELARKLTEDPNFYSGVGEQYNLLIKRGLSALGGDPNMAAPQEGFRKIVSDSIIDQIKGLAGTGAGAVRVAEIKIMEKAAASTDNTPQANRMLIEIASRGQRRLAAIADMAQNYNGGRLDAGFDRKVAAYRDANPLFTPEETANFRQIIDAGGAKKGPPATAAQGVPQHFATPADLDKAIKAKTVKDGQTVSVPGGTLTVKVPAKEGQQ